MDEFVGKKITRMGTHISKDNFGNTKEVVDWVQYSKAYKEYLYDKEMKYRQHELSVLKSKLEYEHKRYGAATQTEVDRYVRLVQQWQPELDKWLMSKKPVTDYMYKDQYGNKVIKVYNK